MEVVSDEEDADGDGDGASDDLVARGPRLEAATGPASSYLKPYQLVGINFLLLLYRQKVRGARTAAFGTGGVRPDPGGAPLQPWAADQLTKLKE